MHSLAAARQRDQLNERFHFIQCWKRKLPEASHGPSLLASSSVAQCSLISFLLLCFLQLLLVTSRMVILLIFEVCSIEKTGLTTGRQDFHVLGQLTLEPHLFPAWMALSNYSQFSNTAHPISSPAHGMCCSCSLLASSFRPLQMHPGNLTSSEVLAHLQSGKAFSSSLSVPPVTAADT